MPLEFDGVNGIIKNTTSDGDVTIKGNDDGSEISALTFDMSAEGVATFNSKVGIKDSAPDVLLHVNQGGEPPAEGMFILEANSASRQLRIQPPTNSDNGFIDYRGGNLTFLDDGTEVARFQGSTGFGIGTSTVNSRLEVAGNATITTADNTDTLSLISTDGDALVGPVLRLFRNSSSPADDDVIGNLIFSGQDGAGNETDFLTFQVNASDVANGAEDGFMRIMMPVASTSTEFFRMNPAGFVFNEGSVDMDFRVESNGNTHMLFVDGGNNKIGVNNASPARQVHITDTIANGGGSLGLTSSDSSTSGTFGIIHFGNNTDSSLASIGGFADGATDAGALIFKTEATGGAIEERVRFSSSGAVFNEGSFDMDFRVESNANTHMLFVDGGNNSIGINNSTPGSYDGGADDLVVGDHSVSSQGITIASDDNSILYFADGTSGDERYRGSIIYNHPADNFIIRTAGFNTRMTIDSTGAVTIPNQPAFLAQVDTGSVNQENLATDGSFLTVAYPNEIFDQNADYNASTYTFTAPVTGRYQLNMMIRIQNVDSAANYFGMYTATSNRNWWSGLNQSSGTDRDPQYVTISSSHLADMDANDTAIVRVAQSGGTAQADIGEGFFSAFLAC
jgi:hypothetical protein